MGTKNQPARWRNPEMEQHVKGCVLRTLEADLHPSQRQTVAERFTEAMVLASQAGLEAAHDYLLGVCQRAVAGAYSNPTPND